MCMCIIILYICSSIRHIFRISASISSTHWFATCSECVWIHYPQKTYTVHKAHTKSQTLSESHRDLPPPTQSARVTMSATARASRHCCGGCRSVFQIYIRGGGVFGVLRRRWVRALGGKWMARCELVVARACGMCTYIHMMGDMRKPHVVCVAVAEISAITCDKKKALF